MDHLWAPWRMTYIEGKKNEGGCVFCRSWKEGVSPKSGVLYATERSFVIINRFPYNNGHIMVVPDHHAASLSDLSSDQYHDLFELARFSQGVLERALKPAGFNWGLNLGKAAGAGIVDHIHLHILPRWDGDTNFMPLLAETKVLPDHLENTFVKLLSFFQGREKEEKR